MSYGSGWGAIEWNIGDETKEGWKLALHNNLNYSNNMLVNVSNWDGGDGIVQRQPALDAIKEVLSETPCYIPANNLQPSGNLIPGFTTLRWQENSTYTSFGVRINDLNSPGFTPPDANCTSTSTLNGDMCANGVRSGDFRYEFQANHNYDYWVWTSNGCGGRDIHTLITVPKNGDINGDGIVNILDYSLLSNSFGNMAGQVGFDSRSDLNNDSVINILDYALLSNNFGG